MHLVVSPCMYACLGGFVLAVYVQVSASSYDHLRIEALSETVVRVGQACYDVWAPRDLRMSFLLLLLFLLHLPCRVTQTIGEQWPSVLIFVGGALISKQKLNDNYNDGNNSRNILFLSCLNSTK